MLYISKYNNKIVNTIHLKTTKYQSLLNVYTKININEIYKYNLIYLSGYNLWNRSSLYEELTIPWSIITTNNTYSMGYTTDSISVSGSYISQIPTSYELHISPPLTVSGVYLR